MGSSNDTGILRRKTILFADDETSVRWATRLLLTMDDHQVTEAPDGGAALDLFEEGKFDLVITDLQMPRMTGDELAAQIKTVAPRQPILLITAYGDSLGDSGLRVDATLSKPFTFAALRSAIAHILKGRIQHIPPTP